MTTRIISATATIILALSVVPAEAQQQKGGKPGRPPAPANRNKGKSASAIEMENYFKKIDKAISFPELPEPTGAKFRFALEKDGPKTTNISQRFGTSSSAQEVVDFYKNGLLANKWIIGSVTTSGVQASKNDRQVSVTIAPRSSLDTKTDFFVSYTYKNR